MPTALQDITDRLSPMRPWLRQVNKATLRADALAGLTNAAIVVPQGVAFAIIAGLPPEYGLYTAMVTAVIAAWWGSSFVMVSGPTTAISAVLFTTLSAAAIPGTPPYVALALALTIVVGCIQLAAGLARLGGLIAFISHSVIVGFTAAAALLIASSQLAGALGLEVARGGGVVERIARVAAVAQDANPIAVGISALTLGSIVLLQQLHRRLPAYLIALALGALAAWAVGAGSAGIAFFAPLPSITPQFGVPRPDLSLLIDLLPGAAAIAFIGLLEAISIGRAFSLKRGEDYDANQEIVGQGLSNIVGGFLQAYAGSGSFTRSGLNAESGARTPMAALFAAVMLLGLLFLIGPLVVFIPVPAMAGIILYVAWRLIDFKAIRHIRASRSETLILLSTFLTGILADLELAVVIGVFGSLLVFLYRSAHPYVAVGAPVVQDGKRMLRNAERYGLPQCPKISITRIEGNVFFASVDAIARRLRQIDQANPDQNIRILGLKGVGKLDLSGADLLIGESRRLRAQGGDFHLIAVYPDLLRALQQLGVINAVGVDHVHSTKLEAIREAVPAVDPAICQHCTARVFLECGTRPNSTATPDVNTIAVSALSKIE